MEFVSIRFFDYICTVKLIVMDNKDFDIENGVLKKYNGYETHVVIPNGVTKIGDEAFDGCENLMSIKIQNSVVNIGKSAFSCHKNLTCIELPNSVTCIDNYAFYLCDHLKRINIPNSVSYIGACTFFGCIRLNNIEIPSSVTYIGCDAFKYIKTIKRPQPIDGKLIAYKAFNEDWTCMHDFKYEVGKSYHQNGVIECCENGFHACTNPLNVFGYYYGHLNRLHFAEVELSGYMDWEEDKVAASDIRIIRELSVSELAEIYNSMEKV